MKLNQPKCVPVIDPVGIESLDDNMILVDIQANICYDVYSYSIYSIIRTYFSLRLMNS